MHQKPLGGRAPHLSSRSQRS